MILLAKLEWLIKSLANEHIPVNYPFFGDLDEGGKPSLTCS